MVQTIAGKSFVVSMSSEKGNVGYLMREIQKREGLNWPYQQLLMMRGDDAAGKMKNTVRAVLPSLRLAGELCACLDHAEQQ